MSRAAAARSGLVLFAALSPAIFLPTLFLSSCGALSIDQACARSARAVCSRTASCFPLLVGAAFTDEADCEARTALACHARFDAPSTSLSPARLDACARKIEQLDCESLATRQLPSECADLRGPLAKGAVCGDDAQCSTAYCRRTGPSCGACAERAQSGATCTRADDCASGLTCSSSDTCVPIARAGEACDAATRPCLGSAVCRAGVCATKPSDGEACVFVAGQQTCDPSEAIWCNPTTRLCEPTTQAPPGEACGLVNGKIVGCGGGGRCKLHTVASGTCLAPAADGAACDSTAGPDCKAPATCASGTCVLPDPSSCR